MPGPEHRTSMLQHDCSEITDLVRSSGPDLKDSPIENEMTVGLLMAVLSWIREREKLDVLSLA